MSTLERNIIGSFQRAKQDIIRLQSEIVDLNVTQKEILEIVSDLRAKLGNRVVKKPTKKQTKKVAKVKAVKTVKTRTARKTFVAAKTGKKFHEKNCPFAQNIKPKFKLTFKSKNTALNKGYKPCDCVK